MMILYETNNTRYIDYHTIKEKTKRSRAFLTKILLNNVEVRKYRNRLLYNVEDLKSTEINKFLQ